ncbi:MAG: hypothetical protein LBU65_11285, partial [Planctomycetaceae bacterium]|nr:hypothetical protein [Planctomycetaceae bacterium]
MLRLQQILVVAVLFGITGCSTFVAENNRKPYFWQKTVSRLRVLMPDSNNPAGSGADVKNVAIDRKQQRQSSTTQTEQETEQANELAQHPQKPETMPHKTPPAEVQSAALLEKKAKPLHVAVEESNEF